MISVHLVRHAQPEGAAGLALGHTDLPLSSAGEAAALQLAESWRGGLPRIVSSDLQRARQTAQALAELLKVPVSFDARLRELDFGAWDGASWQQLSYSQRPALDAWMGDWVNRAPPGGESFAQLSERAHASLAAAIADAAASPVIIYAHAGPIRALLCRALGWELSRAFELPVDYTHASGLRISAGRHTVSYRNASSFPEQHGFSETT